MVQTAGVIVSVVTAEVVPEWSELRNWTLKSEVAQVNLCEGGREREGEREREGGREGGREREEGR